MFLLAPLITFNMMVRSPVCTLVWDDVLAKRSSSCTFNFVIDVHDDMWFDPRLVSFFQFVDGRRSGWTKMISGELVVSPAISGPVSFGVIMWSYYDIIQQVFYVVS